LLVQNSCFNPYLKISQSSLSWLGGGGGWMELSLPAM